MKVFTVTVEVDRCDLPSKINNGNIESDKVALLPGDLVTYTCEKGYELSGQGKRYCLRNGNWSDQQPECLSKCSKQNIYCFTNNP